MADNFDIAIALSETRELSTWGPKFDDDRVLKIWVAKLTSIPKIGPEAVIKAIHELGGKRDFPNPNDILEAARGKSLAEHPEEGHPSQALLKEI